MSKDYQDPDWTLTFVKVIIGAAVNIFLMMPLVFYLADRWAFAGMLWLSGNILLAFILYHMEPKP